MKRAIALLSIFTLCSLALVAVAAQQSPAAARFTEHDLARLKWIEGRWKGMADGKPFYEAYRFISPARLETEHHTDETFSATSGRGITVIEGGRIVHEGGQRQYVASRLTDTSVDFEPGRNAANGFSWTRKTADTWTAVIKPLRGPERRYEMTRVR